MGKFNAAIYALENEKYLMTEAGKAEVGAAISVLEAASNVDERDLGRVHMGFVSAEMRELLEAIKAAKEDE